MLGEMIHDARVIPIGDIPHIGDSIRQWHGDSRGHWEGDTLVVETTNYSPKSGYRGGAEHLHLIERFTLAGPAQLHYEITVTDRTTWTRPWTAMVPMSRSEDALFEYACHEGNIGMAGDPERNACPRAKGREGVGGRSIGAAAIGKPTRLCPDDAEEQRRPDKSPNEDRASLATEDGDSASRSGQADARPARLAHEARTARRTAR